MDIPELVPELSEFLRGRGYEITAEGGDEITVVAAQHDFLSAITLLADLDLWRAKHPWARARLDPQLSSR